MPKQRHGQRSWFGTKVCCTGAAVVAVFVALLAGVITSYHEEENFLPRCSDHQGNEYLCDIPPVDLPSRSVFTTMKTQSHQRLLSVVNWLIESGFSYVGGNALASQAGEVTIRQGIDDVISIQRDKHGIPHITAKNLRDGIFAQGYAEAGDRLYQFEINRRLCSGRLSELFGAKALGTDRFARVLGFSRLNSHSGSSFHQEDMTGPYESRIDTLDYVKAFVEGINSFMSASVTSR